MLSTEELKKLALPELQKTLAKARFNLYKITLAVKAKTDKKTDQVKKQRKYVARILTFVKQSQDKQETK